MLTVLAPAKINLTLEVLAKRPDGFHEIRSVIQTINLCDRLDFQSSHDVTFKCDTPDWIAEESLISKAVSLLQQANGCSKGVAIEVKKHIPLLSGLGGDSSDAAAVLRGLNQFWRLDLSRERLLELARQLGSDVSFFLYGGTALVEGRGELVTPLPPLPHWWVVMAIPPLPRLPGKTKQLYESLRTNHYTDGEITERVVKELKRGREVEPSLLFNTFENVAFTRFSGLDVSRAHFEKIGATDIHLAGSGPTLFTMVEDKDKAEELCILLQNQRLVPYLTETLANIEKIELSSGRGYKMEYKTEKNLQEAFAGESQANRRYTFFADKADKEGYPQIARLFRAAADAETVHARNHFNAMDAVGATKENVMAASVGEHYEFTRMYPAFIDEAEQEQNERAQRTFEYANEVEQVHHRHFEAVLKALNESRQLKNEPYFVCQVCGNTVPGEAPERCPICGSPAKSFKKVE